MTRPPIAAFIVAARNVPALIVAGLIVSALMVPALVVMVSFVPAGRALADSGAISEPAAALSGAVRTGHRVPTAAAQPALAVQVPTEMQTVFELVNMQRTSHGLVAVRFSSQLNEAALDHTRNQAADGQIYHVDPDNGSNLGERIGRIGYVFSTWGENVAAGYPTPREVMDAWMNSPGHCRNILNPAFTEIGVGFVVGGANFGQFWTQSFARPGDEVPPAGIYDEAWCRAVPA